LHTRLENHIHPVLENTGSMAIDAKSLAYRAGGAVGRDQIRGPDSFNLIAAAAADARPDALFVLLEIDQFRIEPDFCAHVFGVRLQNRFKLILVAHGRTDRADVAGFRPRNFLPVHF
jgi:hypothetical protein